MRVNTTQIQCTLQQVMIQNCFYNWEIGKVYNGPTHSPKIFYEVGGGKINQSIYLSPTPPPKKNIFTEETRARSVNRVSLAKFIELSVVGRHPKNHRNRDLVLALCSSTRTVSEIGQIYVCQDPVESRLSTLQNHEIIDRGCSVDYKKLQINSLRADIIRLLRCRHRPQHKNCIIENVVRVIHVALRQVWQLGKPFNFKPKWHQNVLYQARELLFKRLTGYMKMLLRFVIACCTAQRTEFC